MNHTIGDRAHEHASKAAQAAGAHHYGVATKPLHGIVHLLRHVAQNGVSLVRNSCCLECRSSFCKGSVRLVDKTLVQLINRTRSDELAIEHRLLLHV